MCTSKELKKKIYALMLSEGKKTKAFVDKTSRNLSVLLSFILTVTLFSLGPNSCGPAHSVEILAADLF